MSDNKKAELSPEVAKEFALIPGIGIGKFAFKGKEYDLTTLSLDKAKKLVSDTDFKILVPIKDTTKAKV